MSGRFRRPSPAAGQLTLFAEDSPVSHSVLPREVVTSNRACGRKHFASSGRSAPDSSCWRTSRTPGENCSQPSPTFRLSATDVEARHACRLPPWAHRILGPDCGSLATPTAKANQLAPYMMKWPGCRRLRALFGPKLEPRIYEWLMGFPIGWTDLGHSATPSSPRSPNSSADASSTVSPSD